MKNRKNATHPFARANKRLILENANLSARITLAEKSLENSFSGLTAGLMGGSFGGQAPITSTNPLFQNNQYQPITLLHQVLSAMYKTHGLLRAALQVPVLDAVRDGLDLASDQLDHDELRRVEDFLEENGVLDRIVDVFIWARLYGGAALIINTEEDSSKPIGDELLDGGSLEFYDAARWELSCTRRIPENGKYGFYGRTLDASRVITVLGTRAPWLIRAQISDWGLSEVEHMAEDFNLFLRGRNVVYEILDEAKLDVYSLRGFRDQLATPGGTAMVTRRIQNINMLKNFNNALILDKEDTFDQKSMTFGGLAEVLKENRIMMCSALRIPMSKLFGTGATGFNSGAEDLETYAALVQSEVRQPMKTVLRKVLKLVVQHLFGEDLDIRFKFKPLRILSAVDEEAIKSSKSVRFLALYDKLIINSTELGEMMQKEDLVPIAIEAADGLLDEHPMPAVGQPDTGEMGAEKEPAAEKPAASKTKAEKPEKADKPEKANSRPTLRRRK